MHDTVSGRPETAAFDAVLGRSLTVGGLGVTGAKAHGQPFYCHPCFALVCLVPGPIDRLMSRRATAAAATHPRSPSAILLAQGGDFGSSVERFCFPKFP